MKLASRSAMLSLSSAKAGSRAARGLELEESEREALLMLGVVWEARSEVREGGRRGVVGREGMVAERVREWEEVRGRWVDGVAVVAMVCSLHCDNCTGTDT